MATTRLGKLYLALELEYKMHKQLMALWINDLLSQDDMIREYEQSGEFKLEHSAAKRQRTAFEGTWIQSAAMDLRPDSPKQAYLHNHGFSPKMIHDMPFMQKANACAELAKKLGKCVVAE